MVRRAAAAIITQLRHWKISALAVGEGPSFVLNIAGNFSGFLRFAGPPADGDNVNFPFSRPSLTPARHRPGPVAGWPASP